MSKYYIEMKIDFAGYVEADSEEEAEQLAWISWGSTMDADITYAGVDEITVELEEDDDEDDEDE